MERIYAKLTPEQVQMIKQLAKAERRHPSDQIAVMIDQHLAEHTRTTPKERQVSVT
jgi:hypothetical protein